MLEPALNSSRRTPRGHRRRRRWDLRRQGSPWGRHPARQGHPQQERLLRLLGRRRDREGPVRGNCRNYFIQKSFYTKQKLSVFMHLDKPENHWNSSHGFLEIVILKPILYWDIYAKCKCNYFWVTVWLPNIIRFLQKLNIYSSMPSSCSKRHRMIFDGRL